MGFKLALMAALLFGGADAAAEICEREEEQSSAELEDDPDEPMKIVRPQSLATALGLTSDEVVFSTPRNFRTEPLNQMRLDD